MIVVRIVVRLAAIAAALAGLYRYCWLPLQCDYRLPGIKQRTMKAVDMTDRIVAAAIARRNIEELREAERGCPLSVDVKNLIGMNASIIGRNDLLLESLNEALTLDHRPELYFNRALALMGSGRLNEAMPDFVRSSRFDPTVLESLDGNLRNAIEAEVVKQGFPPLKE